jgi:hypothetical protein
MRQGLTAPSKRASRCGSALTVYGARRVGNANSTRWETEKPHPLVAVSVGIHLTSAFAMERVKQNFAVFLLSSNAADNVFPIVSDPLVVLAWCVGHTMNLADQLAGRRKIEQRYAYRFAIRCQLSMSLRPLSGASPR